jgi:hypothetical protein
MLSLFAVDWEAPLRIVGAMAAFTAAVFLWIYGRRLGLEAAQGRLNALNASTIDAFESRVRMLETTAEARDADYKACQRRLTEVERELAAIKLKAGLDAERIG